MESRLVCVFECNSTLGAEWFVITVFYVAFGPFHESGTYFARNVSAIADGAFDVGETLGARQSEARRIATLDVFGYFVAVFAF